MMAGISTSAISHLLVGIHFHKKNQNLVFKEGPEYVYCVSVCLSETKIWLLEIQNLMMMQVREADVRGLRSGQVKLSSAPTFYVFYIIA